jgi:Subtilase family
VDIISISWTIKRDYPRLREAIEAAASRTLIFCSTADEGAYSGSGGEAIWPASCNNVFKVSASDALHHARAESQRGVDVIVEGDQQMAHGPKYMRNHAESHISGSSVATALASGLASLCLCLGRMASAGDQGNGFRRKKEMEKLFAKMREGEADRVLLPKKLFGQGFDLDDDVDDDPAPPKALSHFDYTLLGGPLWTTEILDTENHV